MKNDDYMKEAIKEAKISIQEKGIPIGSVLVYQNRIIGRGHNQRVQKNSSILHGEMDAIENAGRKISPVYRKSVLYTTLSPCPMCAGAILLYKIPKVVIGENVNFKGQEELLKSRGVVVEVLQDDECIRLMKEFVSKYPEVWNEDIGG